MSIKSNVKYGIPLYGKVTYGINEIPETFLVSLDDSTSLSESITDDTIKVLSDTLVSSESLSSIVNKPLADVLALSEQQAIALGHILSDSLTVNDLTLLHLGTKALNDFIVLSDWISINIVKPAIWTTIPQSGITPATVSLYSKILYAKANYGAKVNTSWTAPVKPSFTGWTNQDGTEPR